MHLDGSLIQLASSTPSQPAWALAEVEEDESHSLRPALERALASVTAEEIEDYVTSSKGSLWYSLPLDQSSERRLRFDLVEQEATRFAYERRRQALCSAYSERTPDPYGHPALSDVQPDSHLLVPVREFENARNSLQKGGYAFHVPPTLPAANSSYWLTQQLLLQDAGAGLRVRLDPFIVCSLLDYQPAFYKMITYGQPLDWDRLGTLRKEEHGEWMPDSPAAAGGIQCTQYCWSPRADGVHFQCEELPGDACARPSRYAHAIYDPVSQRFAHADGGMRYYTTQELNQRRELHVRNAGKSGTRVKLFAFGSPLERGDWCAIIPALFVWNDDVQEYFARGDCAEQALRPNAAKRV